jgi:hypothetical protein
VPAGGDAAAAGSPQRPVGAKAPFCVTHEGWGCGGREGVELADEADDEQAAGRRAESAKMKMRMKVFICIGRSNMAYGL